MRLLEECAAEYARQGDLSKAYQFALEAGVSREKLHGRDATNHAIAMQVKFDTEKSRTEAAHQRQLATAEAERANALLDVNETLETLGVIGQEITADLDHRSILAALDSRISPEVLKQLTRKLQGPTDALKTAVDKAAMPGEPKP